MTTVRCELVEPGQREDYRTVGVKSADGHLEYVSLEERFLEQRGQEWFLPVLLIIRPGKGVNKALVQLPFEADSGAKRVWVPADSVEEEAEVTA